MLRISKKDFKIFRMRGRAFCPPSTDRARESFSRAVLPAIGAGGDKPTLVNRVADDHSVHPIVRAKWPSHELRGGILAVAIKAYVSIARRVEADNAAG